MKSKSDGDHGALKRVPYSKPPFTFREIKKAIPPHCFQRSLFRSLSFLIFDLATASLFYYVATTYIPILPHPIPFLAWPLYWIFQGCIFTAFWVLAHECGHHAFSDYKWLNDTVGFIIHSALLIPYFSFKYSHRRHHSNTGSLERDEVFVPKVKSDLSQLSKLLNNPPGTVFSLLVQLAVGWHSYLLFNGSGRRYDRFASHYYPNAPMFNDRERFQIYISNAGILAVCYGLYRVVLASGIAWVFCVYGGPIVVLNGFLALMAYLQHTHPGVPRYDSSEWDWLRGALATVDRDYGILNKVFHNSTNTHVVHHLFPAIPHYHAVEATNAIKPILGDYYLFDQTPILKAMWREAKECVYVESDEEDHVQNKGVFWFKNKL